MALHGVAAHGQAAIEDRRNDGPAHRELAEKRGDDAKET